MSGPVPDPGESVPVRELHALLDISAGYLEEYIGWTPSERSMRGETQRKPPEEWAQWWKVAQWLKRVEEREGQ